MRSDTERRISKASASSMPWRSMRMPLAWPMTSRLRSALRRSALSWAAVAAWARASRTAVVWAARTIAIPWSAVSRPPREKDMKFNAPTRAGVLWAKRPTESTLCTPCSTAAGPHRATRGSAPTSEEANGLSAARRHATTQGPSRSRYCSSSRRTASGSEAATVSKVPSSLRRVTLTRFATGSRACPASMTTPRASASRNLRVGIADSPLASRCDAPARQLNS